MADVCEEAGTWLVCDNTYEAFAGFEDIVGKFNATAPEGSDVAKSAQAEAEAQQRAEAQATEAAANGQHGDDGLQTVQEAMEQLQLKGHACVSGPHVVHVFSFSKVCFFPLDGQGGEGGFWL